MQTEFSRTELLIGHAAIERLSRSKVAVFGIGGVGSYVVEALARSGIGHFVLIDNDLVCLSNINRQLLALHSTLGRPKVEVMRERILDINPKAIVETQQVFCLPGSAAELLASDLDYVVDAIDTVSAKIDLVVTAKTMGIPIICAMGAGNKLDPTRFEVADIYATSVCPLGKVMRRELKKRGVESLKVVYSREDPVAHDLQASAKAEQAAVSDVPFSACETIETTPASRKKRVPGSISFVPSVAGLIMAGEVIKDLITIEPYPLY